MWPTTTIDPFIGGLRSKCQPMLAYSWEHIQDGKTHPPFISWTLSNKLKRAGTFSLHKFPFTFFTHRCHYQCSIFTSSFLNCTKHMVENGRENQSPRRLLISILNLFSRSVLLCNSVLLQVSTMFLQRLYYGSSLARTRAGTRCQSH